VAGLISDEQVGFGDVLRRFRVAAGLSQEALAERASLSARGISDLERAARRRPFPATVRRLAEALGLSEADRQVLQAAGEASARAAPEPALVSARASGRLPVAHTSFVGRDTQLAELGREFGVSRLLTLVGPGGVGKTRLALAAGEAAASVYRNGVAFVDLASSTDPRLVVQTIAAALGLHEQHSQPLREALIGWMQPKHLLLVLDNCEHLVQECAELVADLLQRVPELWILATSREPLGVAGETLWRVPPLNVPDLQQLPTLESLGEIEAVRLFVSRARAVEATFRLTDSNAPAVAGICVQLDGIPLAIELAAARVPLLTPRELSTRLAEPLQVLTRNSRIAPARHQTLRATLDWSYELLSATEQQLFARLSVFVGTWPLEAAEAICAGDGIAREQVLDLLGQLVDKSLVTVSGDDTTRYRLLEPVRQYAAEWLNKTGDPVPMRDRHRGWCLRLVEQAEPEWFGPRQTSWLQRLEQEHDNLRAALTWSSTNAAGGEAGLRLGAALWRFWDMRSYLSEGSDYLRSILSRTGADASPRARARALAVLGYLASLRGSRSEAQAALEEAERLWRAIGDPTGLAVTLFYAGLFKAWTQAEIGPAESLLADCLRLARRSGPEWLIYIALMRLGDLARLRGEGARAEDLLGASLVLAGAANDRWSRARCLHSLGAVRLMRHDGAQARSLLLESLSLAIGLQDRRGISYAVDGLACVAAAEGQAILSASLFGTAQALRESMGDPVSAVFDRDRERGIAMARASLGEAAFHAAWVAARGVSSDQALATAAQLVAGAEIASRGPVSVPAHVPALAQVTHREREVASLIARGLTDREIASQLAISERTACNHVSHILTRLNFRSRAQVAAWATEQGLAEEATRP
jgi:predicted ATPase/DNA-binding CsgD family transcriptional regulator